MNELRLNIDRPTIINLVDEVSFKKISNEISRKYKLYLLNGENIIDMDSFINEFSNQLIKYGKATNLSNFQDLFKDILLSDFEKQTAFVWTKVENMLNGELRTLITFSDILSTISRKLYKKGHVHINFLIGCGVNFPPPL